MHSATVQLSVGAVFGGGGGDEGVGIFRAPPGCPGVERQFSEPSMMKSSLSSRLLQN